MGNKRQPVETKKAKKKGRPSLLDLQKRSLRLQKQQEEQNRNPNPNPSNPSRNSSPSLKFATRRSTRRNPNPSPGLEEEDDEEEEEEEESNGKRKEKKLKLVLRIPNGSDLDGSGPGSDADGGGSRKKRKIGAVETAAQNSNSKATDEEAPAGNQSDSGPTTPLPDKKLLVFILDRLQKKDTYAVFSEPVDPEELPDYHDIIKHPMDFGTVRKKLDSGAYENLEQFESDIFLISSNAMRYNSPDTIYFRQARAIQELAKKDFENLRQESDDDEQEPKTVRRGRPSVKNLMKRIGRPPADRTGSDFSSDATLANARDGVHGSNLTRDVARKGSSTDKPSVMDASRGNNQHKLERNEEYSGSPLKGIPMRHWKKISVIDENRRNTYNEPLQPTGFQEPPILTAFDGDRKLLMPVGLYMEHAYARSLARFAANLGPTVWGIAAKRIERILPPGTKFGPGWIGESEEPNKFHPPLLSSSPCSSSQVKTSHVTTVSGGEQHPESRELVPNNSTESSDLVKNESKFGVSSGDMQPNNTLQVCQNSTMQHLRNGFNPNSGYVFNLQSQAMKMMQHMKSPNHVLDMASRSRVNNSFVKSHPPHTQPVKEEKSRLVVENSDAVNSGSSNSEGQCQVSPLNTKPGLIPPDLNADFRSPGSPVSGVLADSKQKQPHLALQL
ncbi:bromodomain-containing protein DDB_G0270170-like isoform X2 [Asparagus officinalis]|uniref:bromodomain-containing protein DDB_G0270170-like isoform X2 n=1 Tax=Asparagus officinalis TaxID=4686 RepID=UPI00098E6FF1|nr:bromodomain-containing protein DDB_G0270170-like isoform X2 [Asparagus officinalis]